MNTFIATLNHSGDSFLKFAWPMLWQSSLLIAVIFVLEFALRRKIRAAIRYALWLVVLVKLLLPPSLALPTSPSWWIHPSAPPTVKAPPVSFTVSYGEQTAPTYPLLPAPVIPPPKVPAISLAGWTLAASGVVSVGLLALLLVRWRQITQKVRRATSSEKLIPVLDEARRLTRLRSGIRLKLTEDSMSPAVCGLFRPVILLPESLVEKLSAGQLRAVLLHETIHLRRGDVWVKCAQALLQIAYWWHPLVWLANARIRRVREEAVDDAVMLALRDDADIYAPTLLEVAKLAFNRPLASLGLVGILESRSALRQRIERLINFNAPRKAGLTVVSIFGILAFSAVALPMGPAPEQTNKPVLEKADIAKTNTAPANTNTPASLSPAVLHADDISVKISLGIRDTTHWTTHTNVAYPLGFRIENTGKSAIKGDDIAGIFAKGIIHILSNDGQEQHCIIEDEWALRFGIVPNDLQPGETSECKVTGDVVTFIPSAKDGDYQVWWTLRDLKSNVSHFTVTNGKVLADSSATGTSQFSIATQVVAKKQTVRLGDPIIVSVSVSNQASQVNEVDRSATAFGCFEVIDPDGKTLPYVGEVYQVRANTVAVQPRSTVTIADALDLSDKYLFQKAGRYTIRFSGKGGIGLSDSPAIAIEVTAGRLSEFDEVVASLLPVCPNGWHLAKVRGEVTPFGRVLGFALQLYQNPMRGEAVQLWFTKEEEKVDPNQQPSLKIQYLGHARGQFVYGSIGENTPALWPTAIEDISRALQITKNISSSNVDTAKTAAQSANQQIVIKIAEDKSLLVADKPCLQSELVARLTELDVKQDKEFTIYARGPVDNEQIKEIAAACKKVGAKVIKYNVLIF